MRTFGFKYCYLTLVILFILHSCEILIIYRQLYDFKLVIILCKWLNSSIWPIDWTLTGTTILGQSRPGSNGNIRVLHILQSSRTGASPSVRVIPRHLLEVVLPLCKSVVGIFYSPSWQGRHICKYVCKLFFLFLFIQREKKVNISKWIGPLFISFLHMCIFPACCFCHRTFSDLLVFHLDTAWGHMNGAPNETQNQLKWIWFTLNAPFIWPCATSKQKSY